MFDTPTESTKSTRQGDTAHRNPMWNRKTPSMEEPPAIPRARQSTRSSEEARIEGGTLPSTPVRNCHRESPRDRSTGRDRVRDSKDESESEEEEEAEDSESDYSSGDAAEEEARHQLEDLWTEVVAVAQAINSMREEMAEGGGFEMVEPHRGNGDREYLEDLQGEIYKLEDVVKDDYDAFLLLKEQTKAKESRRAMSRRGLTTKMVTGRRPTNTS